MSEFSCPLPANYYRESNDGVHQEVVKAIYSGVTLRTGMVFRILYEKNFMSSILKNYKVFIMLKL